MNQPTFSHVPYPTDYMDIAVKKVKNHFKDNFNNKKVLDIIEPEIPFITSLTIEK